MDDFDEFLRKPDSEILKLLDRIYQDKIESTTLNTGVTEE